MGNRFLQTSISVMKPEIPEQTVDCLARLPFTSCPLRKWTWREVQVEVDAIFIYLSFHAQNNRDKERCFIDLVQINFSPWTLRGGWLMSAGSVIVVLKKNKPSISRRHAVGSESAPAAGDRAAIRALLLRGNEKGAMMSSRQRFIFMPHIAVSFICPGLWPGNCRTPPPPHPS